MIVIPSSYVMWVVSAAESSLFSSGCCKSVRLSTNGAVTFPSIYLGTYEATKTVKNFDGTIEKIEKKGPPIYEKSFGGYIYSTGLGTSTWFVSEKIGDVAEIRGVVNATCPTDISQWQYKDNIDGWHPDGWVSVDITVKCSHNWVHT